MDGDKVLKLEDRARQDITTLPQEKVKQENDEALREESHRISCEGTDCNDAQNSLLRELENLKKEMFEALHKAKHAQDNMAELKETVDRTSGVCDRQREALCRQLEALAEERSEAEEQERQVWDEERQSLLEDITVLKKQCEVESGERRAWGEEREALQREITTLANYNFLLEERDGQIRRANRALREEVLQVSKELTEKLQAQSERASQLEALLQSETALRRGHTRLPLWSRRLKRCFLHRSQRVSGEGAEPRPGGGVAREEAATARRPTLQERLAALYRRLLGSRQHKFQ